MIYIQLIEGMSVIALFAYLYTRFEFSKNLLKNDNIKYKLNLIVFFSLLAILGTYLGVDVKPFAIGNTRPIGAIVAGIIGGPYVGLVVGLIAGTQRYFLGGFTAKACAIATVSEGLIGGLGSRFSRGDSINNKTAFFTGILAMLSEMFIILITAKPYSQAIELEKVIAVPMIVINTLGVIIFLNILSNIRTEYSRISSLYAQSALNIAKRTLSTTKRGFDEASAKEIAEIISEIGEISDVFIGDKSEILAYVGENYAEVMVRQAVKQFYKYPVPQKLNLKIHGKDYIFYCSPLKVQGQEFEGVLGVKINSSKNSSEYFIQFCRELSGLLSMQLEIYRLNKLKNEANTAELKALRAQIHPHFLFNALNTIGYFCRIDAEKARVLILDLSNFLRNTLKRDEDFIEIEEEIKSISSYLAIEKARFGDRLNVEIKVPENLLEAKIPTFILQPLVENSIKHGILEKSTGGTILIEVYEKENNIIFSVKDDGVGMNSARLEEVMENGFGIGLKNVNERLKLLYGEKHMLNIESRYNIGTEVSFSIPKITLAAAEND